MRARLSCVLLSSILAAGAFAQSTIGFETTASTVYENDGTVQLKVIRTGSLTGTAKVDYQSTGGATTAAGYFVPVSGTLTFGNGEDEKSFTVTLIDDNDTEPAKTFEFLLTNWVNSTYNDNYAHHLQIKDNEPPLAPLALSYGNLAFSEGDGVTNTTLTVNLNRASDQEIWFGGFHLYPSGNSADYHAGVSLGDLRFLPGETTKNVALTITGNDTYESITKTFHFRPIQAIGPSVTALEFDIVLTEDDPQPSVSIADISVPEGSCGPTPIELTLTATAPVNGYVQWTTNDGTATESDIDYGPFGVHEPVYFNNSTTAKLTVVAPYGDLNIEGDETFTVTLTSATNMTIDDATATVTIENDDEELPSFVEELVRIEAGQRSNLTIQFPAPAPAGSVQISSSDPRVIVPASVVVAERATSVTFEADATEAVGRVTITANLGGQLGKTQIDATVDAFRDSDLRFQGPRRIAFAGETSSVSLTLDPPRETDVTVQLTASAGIVAPQSVVVPAGQSVSFDITSLAAGPGWIEAKSGDLMTSIVLDIAAQQVKSFLPDLAPTSGGTDVTVKGTGFSSACTAKFGELAAQTTFVDGETLIAKTPAHVAANVRITVTCGVTPVASASEFQFATPRRRASRH